MSVLVTGGAGYIGSVTVERLTSLGRSVVVLDDLSRGHRRAVDPSIALEVGSLLDEAFVERVFEAHDVEAVFHFAASSLVGESMQDPGHYFHNNVGGVEQLLRVMVRHGCRRFILSSTAATYGDPASVPILESAPNRPTNPYGESKLMCERMLHWFEQVHGVRWVALRYFNAAGASERYGEDHTPETHLIPLAIDAAYGRRDGLKVFGLDYPTRDGTCIRDYIHVSDLAEAHVLGLTYLETHPSGIFNLGNGSGFSVLEVLKTVEVVSGRAVPWEKAARRAGDPPELVASSARAQEILEWTPRHAELAKIVESAIRWSEAHPDGYDDA